MRAAGRTVTAIPQTYRGVRFRSKLEATWALNLDHLGIEWTYEPEAFTLPSGASYLPDFWLPGVDSWLEVKGFGVDGLDKAREFAGDTEHLVLIGLPPQRGSVTFDAAIRTEMVFLLRCWRCRKAQVYVADRELPARCRHCSAGHPESWTWANLTLSPTQPLANVWELAPWQAFPQWMPR